MNNDLNQLLIDLINIPSWVDYSQVPIQQNENALVDYLYNWFKSNTDLTLEKQELPGNRFNLIAKKGNPDLLLLAHTDTVAPSVSAQFDQTKGTLIDNIIYGRGATDMKSGIASILLAIKNNPNAQNFWACFYADEEYYFLGSQEFVKKYSDIKPKYLVSADGSDLKLGHGCRGLVEIRFRIRGKTGHASKGNGLNAIEGVYIGYQKLREFLNSFTNTEMGNTSSNLAWILGGTDLGNNISLDQNQLVQVGQAGNVIPDLAEFIIDIRPASTELTTEKIVNNLKTTLVPLGYSVEVVEITHNKGAWYTKREDVQKFAYIVKAITNKDAQFADLNKTGYLDLQLIWEKVGKPTSVMFGGGIGMTAHSQDEKIAVESLELTGRFFDEVLKKFC